MAVSFRADTFYGADTSYGNYAGNIVCCIYADFELVLSVTGMLKDISVAIMQVTVSILQLCS